MGTLRIDLMPGRLEDRLKQRAPELGVKKIISLRRSPGGLSTENYYIEGEADQGRFKWVMRMEPPGGVLEPYDVIREYRVMKALLKSEVPVPKVLYAEEDPEPLGGRFFLMEFVKGHVFVHTDPKFQQDEKLRSKVLKDFVELLAKMHRTPPPVDILTPIEGMSYAQSEVQRCKRRLEEVELFPDPLMRYVIQKLEENIPKEGPQVIVHGDFRLSNMIWRKGKIVALLDWERARLGDPLSDIGFSHQSFLHGWCSVTGEYLNLYTSLTGFEIDEKRLTFYKLLEFVKTLLVGLSAPAAMARGKNSDLRLFSVSFAGLSLEPMVLNLVNELIQ
ncbi:MAG: phosphotransferase family protein [Candidatus Anstonellales archaeon]